MSKKRFYNEKKGQWYTEGNVTTLRLARGKVLSGVPTEGQLSEAGFKEVETPEAVDYKPTYEEVVVEKIREKYSIDDEIAILRQRDRKTTEFNEYDAYCEQCKQMAKEETGGNEA